jgi:hypothetical protein
MIRGLLPSASIAVRRTLRFGGPQHVPSRPVEQFHIFAIPLKSLRITTVSGTDAYPSPITDSQLFISSGTCDG